MHDIFFFTDVHGMYELYRAAIDYCMEQDPECTIIFGGDAIDRGPDGYKIMKEMLDNSQILYLKGNHEDLFVHAAYVLKEKYDGPTNKAITENFLLDYIDYDLAVANSLMNGGINTLSDWIIDGMPMDIVEKISQLPLTFSYENIDFCHAGGRYKEFQRAARDEYDGQYVDKDDFMMLAWDRNYIGHGWETDRICVFGHTPVVCLPAKYYCADKSIRNAHPCAYTGLLDDRFNGRKIDMDTCAFTSEKLYVLNVLTMKAQGFKKNQNNVEKIEVIQF